MNDDDLHTALHDAAPDPPDTGGWASSARDRARRSTRLRTAGVGVAVLAVVAGLSWQPLTGQDTRAVPAQRPSATALPNSDCTAGLSGERSSLPARGTRQVTRVSLCASAAGATFTTPLDAVTEHGGELYDAIAALPAEDARDPDCTPSDDRRYLVVFTMADGARSVLEATTSNACGVTSGSRSHTRWTSLLKVLRTAWAEQRSRQSAPDLPARCLSYDQPGLFTPTITDVRAGAACRFDAPGRVMASAPVPADLLAMLTDDLTRRAKRASNIDSKPTGEVLTLEGPWSDPLVLWRVDGDQWFAIMPDGLQLFWQPSTKIARRLSTLVG